MRVVVTGGAGFIGGNLCKALNDTGAMSVVVLDNLSTGLVGNLDGVPVQLVTGSILDRDALDEVCAGADSIVHLAAVPSVPRSIKNPVASHTANVTGTVEVLEAARRHDIGHIVVASSSSVYGANPELPKHEDLRCEPMSPYAVSKLAAESYALSYSHCFGLSVLALRFFNVFGPLQPSGHAYAAVIPAFVDAALAGRALPIDGEGTQSRDFTFVDSVTSVITRAVLDNVGSPGPVNLAFGSRSTLLDVVDLLEQELGRDLRREHRAPRNGDVPHSQADGTRLQELFPDLSPVSLSDGLRATVDWFREVRAVSV